MAPPARVCLGVVVGAKGLRGEVRIKSFTEDPGDIGAYGAVTTDDGRKFDIAVVGAAKGAVIAKLSGIADRTAAEGLRGLRLHVARSALPQTGPREWYEADLIGLAAVGRDGRDWGKVMAFHDFGAGLTMEVSGGTASRGSVMLPFNDAAVPEIDVAGGKVVVDPPAGVLPGGSEKEA